MTEDWYRSPDYSQEAMSEFQNRLSRARPNNRAQYLRVKAGALAALRVRAADEVAISLLRRIISEYPDVWYEVNAAHEELGAIYERMEQFQEAESEYRQVVAAYAQSRSGTSGCCDLTLAELIIRTRQSGKYAEAAELLIQAAQARLALRSHLFRYWLASSRLSKLMGVPAEAAKYAQKALDLAGIKEPQFPRHPTVGVVTMDLKTRRELAALSQPKSLSSRIRQIFARCPSLTGRSTAKPAGGVISGLRERLDKYAHPPRRCASLPPRREAVEKLCSSKERWPT